MCREVLFVCLCTHPYPTYGRLFEQKASFIVLHAFSKEVNNVKQVSINAWKYVKYLASGFKLTASWSGASFYH